MCLPPGLGGCRNYLGDPGGVGDQTFGPSLSPVPSLGQVTGMPYLHFVLGPTIARVFEEKKYVELDPGKVEIKDVG